MLRVVLAWAFSAFSLSLKGRIRTPTTTEHSCLKVEFGVNKLTSSWNVPMALFQQKSGGHNIHDKYYIATVGKHWSSAIGYLPRRNLTVKGGGIVWLPLKWQKPDHNNHYQHTRRRLRNHEWGWSLHIPGLADSIESEIPNIRVSECCQSCSIWPDHKQNAIRTTCHHQISRRTTATCATLKQHTQCVFAPKCRLTAYNHCESLNPASGWLLQTLSHCHSFQPFVGFHLCSKRSSGCNQSNHLIMTNHLDSMHSFVKESTSCQKMKSHLDCIFLHKLDSCRFVFLLHEGQYFIKEKTSILVARFGLPIIPPLCLDKWLIVSTGFSSKNCLAGP